MFLPFFGQNIADSESATLDMILVDFAALPEVKPSRHQKIVVSSHMIARRLRKNYFRLLRQKAQIFHCKNIFVGVRVLSQSMKKHQNSLRRPTATQRQAPLSELFTQLQTHQSRFINYSTNIIKIQ